MKMFIRSCWLHHGYLSYNHQSLNTVCRIHVQWSLLVPYTSCYGLTSELFCVGPTPISVHESYIWVLQVFTGWDPDCKLVTGVVIACCWGSHHSIHVKRHAHTHTHSYWSPTSLNVSKLTLVPSPNTNSTVSNPK